MGILFKNADITLYNQYWDSDYDCDRYQRTVIKGVNWQGKRNGTVGEKGLKLDNSFLVFIDSIPNCERTYISPKKFLGLSKEERQKHFTFNLNDRIVKGAIDFEITESRGNTLADLSNSFDDVISILGVTPLTNHFEIEGK